MKHNGLAMVALMVLLIAVVSVSGCGDAGVTKTSGTIQCKLVNTTNYGSSFNLELTNTGTSPVTVTTDQFQLELGIPGQNYTSTPWKSITLTPGTTQEFNINFMVPGDVFEKLDFNGPGGIVSYNLR